MLLISFSFCLLILSAENSDFAASPFWRKIEHDIYTLLLVSPKNTEKHMTNTGLLARPHSIRKTRLNVFIRSNTVREATTLPETDQ